MKNFFRFGLLICLVFGLIASVYAKGNSEAAGSAGSTGKPKSITLMVDGTWLAPDNGEEIPEQGYEALTGIDLIINHPQHNEYYPKLDLAFTTGDIPDVFTLGALQYVRYAANGALYDMTEMFEKSKLKNNIEKDIVDACRINGRLYGIPHHRGNGTLTYVRQDWLDALGLDHPKNFEEFLDMLRAFKNNNPDGLAPEDVIPITAPGLANKEYPMDIYFREFYQDATPDYIVKNGKWVDGMLEPNMQEALARMRDAYVEGLIDAEIITNQTSTCRNKFYSGIVGVFNYWAGYWNDRLIDNTVVNVPHAKVVGIPAIAETYYIERPPGAMAMSAGVADPQGIFDNWFELMHDEGEGTRLFSFGVEGKSYKVVDGVIEFLPSILNPDVPYNKVFIDPSGLVNNYAPKFIKQPHVDESHAMFQKYNVQYGLPNPSEELGKLQAEINVIKMNVIAEVVFGDLTIEEGMAKYKSEIKKYNDAVLPDMNK